MATQKENLINTIEHAVEILIGSHTGNHPK